MSFEFIFPYLLTVAACAVSLSIFFAQRRKSAPGRAVPAKKMAVLVPVAAVVCARLAYFAFRWDEYVYGYGLLSVLDLSAGSCLMYGGILGALLCAALLAKKSGVSAAQAMNEITVPGLAAVAVCRFAEYFTPEGIGPLFENPALCFFPLAVKNRYDEWNMAVFMFEAVAALLIIALLLKEKKKPAGSRVMTALLLYSCCQIPLENLRSDSCLRIGFVRVSQIIAVLLILAVIYVRTKGYKEVFARRAGVVLACTAVIGVIEWAEDKTNIPNILLYIAMISLCAVMAYMGREALGRKKA